MMFLLFADLFLKCKRKNKHYLTWFCFRYIPYDFFPVDLTCEIWYNLFRKQFKPYVRVDYVKNGQDIKKTPKNK